MATAKGEHRKLIATPEIMLEAFEAFVKHQAANPIKQKDFMGNSAIPVTREYSKPLTIEAFSIFLKDNYGVSFKTYYNNKGEAYGDFIEVVEYIKERCFVQCFEGGMVGIYNQALTARKLGLVDKQEIKQETIEVNFDLGNNKPIV